MLPLRNSNEPGAHVNNWPGILHSGKNYFHVHCTDYMGILLEILTHNRERLIGVGGWVMGRGSLTLTLFFINDS